MTTPKRTARASARYEPNDSPFGDAFRAWRGGASDGNVVLNGIVSLDADPATLDEFASCARSLLGAPLYADDQDLRDFLSDLEPKVGAAPLREQPLERAREIYRGDWDAEGTISVHLPVELAMQLLAAKGWTRNHDEEYWVAPDGHRYWETDEALRIAVAAEALS